MYTIGKLAAIAGIGVESVRFYQRKGLLEVPEFVGKVRYYGEPHQRRLRFIKKAQVAGFTLQEIKLLLALDASHDHAQARQLANQRLAALNTEIEQLMVARDALKRLAHQCAENTQQPCAILAAFEA